LTSVKEALESSFSNTVKNARKAFLHIICRGICTNSGRGFLWVILSIYCIWS
jgi:hypothetical protein